MTVGCSAYAHDVAIGLVVDLSDDLLQHIFKGHDSGDTTTLVDDYGELFTFGLETPQRI